MIQIDSNLWRKLTLDRYYGALLLLSSWLQNGWLIINLTVFFQKKTTPWVTKKRIRNSTFMNWLHFQNRHFLDVTLITFIFWVVATQMYFVIFTRESLGVSWSNLTAIFFQRGWFNHELVLVSHFVRNPNPTWSLSFSSTKGSLASCKWYIQPRCNGYIHGSKFSG